MPTRIRLAALAAAAALSLTSAACGGSDSSSSASSTQSTSSSAASASVSGEHDDADVSFTQNMIVHHQGAIAMAELAGSRATTPQVKDLADRIKAAQQPEIDRMTAWLEAWGEPAAPTGDPMAGMDHSGGAMGMMTDEQVNQLTAASGTDFDRMFLQMMTTHHQGAIEMAQAEQSNGSNPQAVALARSIATSQTAEVGEMNQLLQNLGS